MTKDDLKYSDPVARNKYRRDWTKKHYRNIVGLRPITKVQIVDEAGLQYNVYPHDFLFRKKGEQTYRLFGHNDRVHFPRSLGRRVRITLNEHGKIVGETDKCFAR